MAVDREARHSENQGPRFWRGPVWLRALLVAAAIALVFLLALVVGEGLPAEEAPGIGGPGPITGWGVRFAKLALDLTAVVTIGSLLFGVLAPSRRGTLDRTAVRAVRTGSLTAWGWALSAALSIFFGVSEFVGTPLQDTDYTTFLSLFIAQTPQGKGLGVVLVLAVVVAATARSVETLNGAALVLLIAIAGILPPALTGHSASAANHDLATSSLVVHIVAISLWVGGLAALVLYARSSTQVLKVAAHRFSSLALWCFIAAGVSGIVNALLRLGALYELWQHRYGWLVIGKLIALLVLGYLGWTHRRRTLKALDDGTPGAFRRLALGEAAVMACTVALAVALAQSPPPIPREGTGDVSAAEGLIGFPVPPFSASGLASLWRPDALVLIVALGALILYVGGVRRLRTRGISWPVGRTVMWVSGVLVTVVVTTSGVATYAPAMFSVHMVQHMVLTMLVPILLAMGAPITLAMRALPARPAVEGDRTAREWILVVLHSRVMKALTHPVVILALYVGTLYAFYFSPLFAWAMRTHEGHMLMTAHFLAVGCVFFWPIIAIDPMPRKLPPLGRMLVLFASIPFHAFFGVIVMMSPMVIAAEWYDPLKLPWVDRLADQNFAGGFAWSMAEIPSLIVLGVVFVAWYRSEERAARRADRNEAEYEAYNAMLARISTHDERHP